MSRFKIHSVSRMLERLNRSFNQQGMWNLQHDKIDHFFTGLQVRGWIGKAKQNPLQRFKDRGGMEETDK
jgi:hypothetical protein